MGGWASILFFCSGRAGGRRDFVVENRVGVGGRPDTPGPVGGPVCRALLDFRLQVFGDGYLANVIFWVNIAVFLRK